MAGRSVSNAKHLVTANLFSQILNVGTLAVIAKFYSSYDFGLLTMLLVIPSILLSISTGRYEQAIQLPSSDEESAGIATFSLILVFCTTILSLLTMLLFSEPIAMWLGSKELVPLLPWMAPFVLFSGGLQVLRLWSIRKSRYRKISRALMMQTVVGNIIILVGPIIGKSLFFLILGTFLRQYMAVIPMVFWVLREDRNVFGALTSRLLRQCARDYFALSRSLVIGYSLASANFQIIVIAIGRIWGVSAVGEFQLAYKMALLPCTIVADAASEVFKQKAVSLLYSQGHFGDLMARTMKTLLAYSLIPYIAALSLSPIILGFLLDEKWQPAIVLVQILLVQSYFTLGISPIDKWASILQDRFYIYAWQGGKTLSILLVSGFVTVFPVSLPMYVSLVSFVIVGFFLIDAYWGLRRSSMDNKTLTTIVQ